MGDITPHEITVIIVHNLPLVTTHQVNDISSSAANCGGNIIDEGGNVVTARGVCWSTVTSPTLENKHTSEGSGMGEFPSFITDLIPQTSYYVRAYATNFFGTGYGQEVEFTTGSPEPDPVEDIDGNSYKTTQIGSQIWMAENLRVVHYADGTPIPLITDRNEWENLGNNDIDKAYCWYDNGNGTDNYGFNGLPGGLRDNDNYPCEFRYTGDYGYWWNSNYQFSHVAYYFNLLNWQANATSGSTRSKSNGFSVRCIKN